MTERLLLVTLTVMAGLVGGAGGMITYKHKQGSLRRQISRLLEDLSHFPI